MKVFALSLILSLLAYTKPSQPNMTENSSTKPINYLALGDSYTIGESVEESERWPVQLASKLREDGIEINSPKIIATTGWRTDELKAAIENDGELLKEYDLVSLLIGVNNQYQGRSVESFAPEFEELLQTAISLAGNSKDKVFVVSIPDYGRTPFGAAKAEQIERELNQYNEVSEKICSKYGVKYFNITPISRQTDPEGKLVANDSLHPSGEQYRQWVDSFYSEVAKMVQK